MNIPDVAQFLIEDEKGDFYEEPVEGEYPDWERQNLIGFKMMNRFRAARGLWLVKANN